MPRTALGEGGGLTRTHSDRPKTTHHPQKSGLADFQVENLQAYELSGLAPVFACGEATKPGLAPNGSLNQHSPLRERVKANDVLAKASLPIGIHSLLALKNCICL